MVRIISLLLISSLLVTAPPTAKAEGEDGGPGLKIVQLLLDLQLTDDQKADAATILKSHREELRSGFEGVRNAQEVLFDAIHQDSVNETEIREASKSVAEAEVEFALARARVVSELRSILNDSQRAVLAQAKSDAKVSIDAKITMAQSLFTRWVDRNAHQ